MKEEREKEKSLVWYRRGKNWCWGERAEDCRIQKQGTRSAAQNPVLPSGQCRGRLVSLTVGAGAGLEMEVFLHVFPPCSVLSPSLPIHICMPKS